jgi:DNA processing protein
MEEADRQMERAVELGVRIIQLPDDDYPPMLREIYSPPVTLYVLGELTDADQAAVAIVGTRNATTYGRMVAERYAGTIASAGVTVVSGLARGVDMFAHTAALDASGRTIAVVASGLDKIGPFQAARLAEKIASNGAVICEYPFGVRAMPAYFPQRNRIISGITSGTLVVESDERGGAMITAGFALDQNREVFAVPGSISSPKSRGTNLLIRSDRARLTQQPEDLLDALGYHIPTPAADTKTEDVELSMFERRILDVLGAEPVHVDALCEETKLAASEVLVSLLGLEFKGLVRQMAGKMFLRAGG